jgi:co-chaperonin GroES (HSP10)
VNAYGQHLIIRRPSKKALTDGGIILPEDRKQKFFYGRVVSTGGEVNRPDVHGALRIQDGDFVVYDQRGEQELHLDPTKDADLVSIHRTMVYALIDADELDDRKLPIPE